MKKIIALVLVLFATVSSAVPLETWPDWVTTAPFIAKQVPPSALVARGTGTNAYYVLEVNPTTGAIPVDATVNITIDYSGATGVAVPSEAAYVAGIDPNGDLQGLATTTAGILKSTFAATPATTLPPESALVAGEDTNNVLRNISVDTSGRLLTVVASSALPSGAATSALQTTGNAILTTIDADTGNIATSVASIDTKTPTVGQKTMANSSPVVIASDQSAIPASQSGTWNINNISGTVSLPTGAATAANQATIITELQDIEAAIGSSNALTVKDKVNLSYSSTNVTTSAYVQILASTAGTITSFTAFEGSGQGMILATGAAASEVDLLYIPPGGFDFPFKVSIAAGTRLSLKAITATANAGRFIANFTGP